MIRCLSREVQGKLRSGVAISSLQQCVEELILNSIDAEATSVGVRVDTEAFKVQVIDNGVGMNADDMECLGNRYHTSKCHSAEDLENLRWYGFRGEALSSIVSFATLVEISSRARSSVKTHVKLFKEGKGLNVFEAEASRPSVGTTVVICNFFYNMPVRRKRMDPILEGERIRQRVEAISLMHPSLSFTLKNDCTQAMLVQLPKAKSTYHRFVQIHSLTRAQNLGEINFTHRQFEMTGYIGREGHYNNSLQFLYVNNRLLLKTRIHKLLNFLLRRLSSLNQKNDSPESSAVRSPKHKRSQELHGVYVINIKCSYSEYDICLEPAKTLIEFKDWDSILVCVEEAAKAFLKRENLMTVDSQDDVEYDLPKMFNTNTEGKEGQNSGTGEQTIGNVSSLDCSFEMKLASNPVHRKSKEDCVNEESVIPQSGLAECEGEAEQLGQQEIRAKELDDTDSEGSMSREHRSEPLCDLAIRERASDHNVLEEKGSTFNKPREYCQISFVSNSVIVESVKLGASKERNINNTASASNMASVDSITDSDSFKQKLPGYQHTGEHRHTVVNNRKISLSDPYVHERLHPPDSSQFNKSVYQPQLQAPRCEESTFKSRRKVLLDAGHDAPCQILDKDIAPVVLSKIPRFSTCPKVSLSEESGSLEKFRTLYGKSDKLKLTSQETHQENAKLPLTDRLVLNFKKPLVCCGDRQGGTETEETHEDHKSPAATVDYASLKPVSVETGGKKSLAGKLCHLKQHGMKDPKLSAQPSRIDAFQDSSTDRKYCGTALNPAPVPSCSTKSEMAEKEEGPASGDWLLHYDTSLGKTVYINKLTGLSRYDDPPMEETQVRCVSDVSNMAVNVVSELGMEYRCYPFQGDLVLPFLPKSRIERVVSLGLDDKEDNNDSSNSLSSLFSKWKNPVFVRPPMVGVDLSSRQADGLAVKIHNILFPYRFSKAMIHSMKVIHQVDKKFLACLISTRDEEAATLSETEGNLLVLVDQHAAHERVRLENLIADSYEDDPDAPGERRLCSSTILPPLEIRATEEELRLFRACQPHLRSLGLEVKFSQAADPQIFVGKVPVCFMEKESNELRRGRPSVIKPIVEEYLQEQLELLRSTGRVKGTLPLTVLKVLASLACHGAIKFNDSLSRDECHSLVASLSSCQLPFQCAHGRPSIAPLADILHLDKDQKELQKPNLQKLRRMYKAWQLYGNK